ncbi:cytochrome p450 [Rhyzopertha dominica]|nr:cytochrome p450 [Rhyzopertha dominica]
MLKEDYYLSHEAFIKLGKQYNTNILGLYLGDIPTVVTLDHSLTKELLTRDEFIGRNDTIITRTRALGQKLGIFFVDGPYWKEQRRFMLRNMRDFGFGRRSTVMEDTVTDEVKYLIDLFTRNPNESEKDICRKRGQLLFPDTLYGTFMNALLLSVASTNFDNRLPLREFARAALRIQRSGDATGCAISITPWLRYIAPDLFGYTPSVVDNATMLDFLRPIIAQHRETYVAGQNRDFIDTYLEELHNNADEYSSFSDDQLLLTLLDVLFATAIACGHTMNFYFALLLNNTDVQAKIQTEIDSVVGRSRLPNLDDRRLMPYTEASIKEAIRITPINPLGIARRCIADCTMGGYFIPKGAIMLPCVLAAHMDETVWDSPKKFKPERWLDSGGNLIKRDDTLGFGAGKRLCAGETFARQNMFLVVSGLLQNFTFRPADGESAPDVWQQVAGLNVSVPDYWVQVIPR